MLTIHDIAAIRGVKVAYSLRLPAPEKVHPMGKRGVKGMEEKNNKAEAKKVGDESVGGHAE